MPDEEKEKQGEFKVTDRRAFTSDGQRRPGAEAPTSQAQAPPREQPAAGASRARPEPEHRGPVEFQHLVLSLATSAMFQMGLARSPGEEAPELDLPAAQETITLLEILEKKTKGNLTQEEEALLSNSLFELRMNFVELSRRAGRGA